MRKLCRPGKEDRLSIGQLCCTDAAYNKVSNPEYKKES